MPRAYLPVLLLGIVTVCAVCLGLRWRVLLDAAPLPATALIEPARAGQAAPAATAPPPASVAASGPAPASAPAALPLAAPAPPPAAGSVRVELNTAGAAQLERLPGIGPVLAQRIVDYRRQHGAFKSVDQLLDVSGIGPKKFAELKDWAYVQPLH
jgi:competence protein ComEA